MMKLQQYKGTIALVGDKINEIAHSYITQLREDAYELPFSHSIDKCLRNAERRDQSQHHITIVNPLELKEWKRKYKLEMQTKSTASADKVEDVSSKLKSIVSSFNDEIGASFPLFALGVGAAERSENIALFVVIHSSTLQLFRKKQFKLSSYDFHITLGFSATDLTSISKDSSTLLKLRKNNNNNNDKHTERYSHFLKQAEMALDDVRSVVTDSDMYLAQWLAREGYLCGIYFNAKFNFKKSSSGGSLELIYNLLKDAIFRACKVKRIESSMYAEKVCKVLNRNLYEKAWWERLRRFYYEEEAESARQADFNIQYIQMPRNFSFINERIAGSSIVDKPTYLTALTRIGVTDVITVMENPLPAALTAEFGALRFHHFAVDDQTPPKLGQMKAMMDILIDNGDNCEEDGGNDNNNSNNSDKKKGKVVVHCMGGVGRTATVLAAYMMYSGERPSLKAAKDWLIEHRKTILSDTQVYFLNQWYKHCEEKRYAEANSNNENNSEHASAAVAINDYLPALKQLPPVIMMVGYPSSGKSTFATALVQTFEGVFQRINQDEQGRRECENAVGRLAKAAARSRGASVVLLDRCNLSASERKHWLDLIGSGVRVWAVHLRFTFEECRWRIVRRKNHPTVKQGGGLRILDSLEGDFEEPKLAEGFERIVTLHSVEEVNSFLMNLGVQYTTLQAIAKATGGGDDDGSLIKFPRTRHLLNLGAATRDDLILTPQDVKSTFLHRVLIVEEKIDGANMGISIRDNKLVAQNRSHYVDSSYHSQFKLLDKWLYQRQTDLWAVLESDRFILYGEWVFAQHSIAYDALPDYFIAFDLYDRLNECFLSRKRLEERLQGTAICIIPKLCEMVFTDVSELRELIYSESKFCKGKVEGVYVRLCDEEKLLQRAKIVREDFLSGNEHWSKGIINQNKLKY